jgi:hypothetical protein
MKRLSAVERKNLDRAVEEKHRELRALYPEIRGKRLDWVTHHVNDGTLYVDIRFQDGTEFYLSFDPRIAIRNAVLWNPSKSKDEVIRTYTTTKEGKHAKTMD